MVVEAREKPPDLEVWRCPKCGRILAKLRSAPGSYVQVKCGSCNNIAEKSAG